MNSVPYYGDTMVVMDVLWRAYRSDFSNPTDRTRCYYVAQFLQKQGLNIELSRKLPQEQDIWIVQYAHDAQTLEDIRLARSRGVFVVYDLNDNHLVVDDYATRLRAREIVRSANLVVCSSEHLASHVKRFQDKVQVIEDPLEPALKSFQNIQPKNPLPVMAWQGMPRNIRYLAVIKDVLSRLYKQQPFVLKVISRRKNALDSVLKELKCPVAFCEWQPETWLKQLALSDIHLAPLHLGSEFCLSKAHHKVSTAIALGRAVVASPIPAYKNVIHSGINGFLAESDAQWFEALSALLEQEELRERLGAHSQREVLGRYSLESIAGQWRQLLSSVGVSL